MLSLDEVKSIVTRHFRVYDAREESAHGVGAHVFFVMFPQAEFDTRFEAAKQEIQTRDPHLLVFMRHDGGEDLLIVAERAPSQPQKTRVHAILLGLTVLTTMLAGAISWSGYRSGEPIGSFSEVLEPQNLLWGFLTFGLPLMAILGIHEMAHFIAARRHGLRATLPFFIPVPPMIGIPFGTLGAFISMKDPLPDRKALFDVGASGPIAGFLVALPVVVAGAWLTGVVAEPIPDEGRPILDAGWEHTVKDLGHGEARVTFGVVDGPTWLSIDPPDDDETRYTLELTGERDGDRFSETHTVVTQGEPALRSLDVGQAEDVQVVVTWDDGLIEFGDPLLVKGLNLIGLDNDGYLSHPMYFAGWAGLLVTGINLLPVGQLDGGHVARAVFGERTRFVAYGAVLLLMMLVFVFQSWLLMALFVLLLGIQHPPPLNDRTVLDRKRMVMAALVLVVFVITFVPRPIIL